MEKQNLNTDNTSVEKINLDVDSWIGAPGADSIITPEINTEEKPNIFSSAKTDISFLDDEEKEENNNSLESKDVIEEISKVPEQDDFEKFNGNKTKSEKSGLVNFLKKRIESNEMFAFDDFDESKQSLDDYLSSLSEKDVDELWQANISNLKEEVASQTPAQFFESLPEELQYAAKYVADGGQDLKGLFQVLAQVEQVREMDPSNDGDQETIVRSYLQATNFGDAEEIEEELNNWKDLGQLEKKAKQFKPKLDAMQEEIIQSKLAQQEMIKQQQEQAAQAYVENVFEALRPGQLAGLKLDKKVQSFLYNGLIQTQYPSISGNPTNLLGHLLEKYQYVEPRYDLIAEALWLLSNPEDYRNNIKRLGGNEKIEQTVRALKTEQSRSKNNVSINVEQNNEIKKLTRQRNIFQR